MAFAACALSLSGYPEQAYQKNMGSLKLASETGQPLVEVSALFFAGLGAITRCDSNSVKEVADRLNKLARKHGFLFYEACSLSVGAYALVEESRFEEGIQQYQKAQAMYKKIGAHMEILDSNTQLAKAYCKAGKIKEGLEVINHSLEMVQKTNNRIDEPELYRLKGELLLCKEEEAEAEECFLKAIKVAKNQKTRTWELRATMSLCRLWQHQDKIIQAQKKLSEIYNWFTEGFYTPDLQEAKSLLESLS